MSHEVIIDGVRYIPAKEVHPLNTRAIKLALLEHFWGDCSTDSDEKLDQRFEDLTIKIDEFDYDHGFTITNLLDRIAELS